MRLCTLNVRGEFRAGIMLEHEILDLRAAGSDVPLAREAGSSVRRILESGTAALDALRRLEDEVRSTSALAESLRERAALVPAADAVLAPAIPDPGMVLAAGLNYHEHLREMNTPTPALPYAFSKSVAALVGSGAPIVLPAGHDAMVDWEGEFCAVIGRTCRNVEARDALKHVAGYTLINDVSARDWVAGVFASSGIMGAVAAWEENLLGKQFPTFCPLGPVVVTADELPDPRDVRIQTRLNGTVMQDAHTSDLVFGVAELIAYYSQFYELRPGDVLSTGSPSGVGFARKPQIFMHAGDVVEVEAKPIGILRSPVRQ